MKRKLFRKESDFLGAKLLFEDLYYGIQSLRAIHNFPMTGRYVNKELVRNILLIKKAACKANRQTGLLSAKKAKVIIKAVNKLLVSIEEEFEAFFPLDSIQGGAYTSLNMNVNEVIANLALEILGERKGDYSLIHPNDDVNLSQSTNDVVPTAMQLTTITLIKQTVKSVNKLDKLLTGKADEFNKIVKLGRTHLQDAVPISLGAEFRAYAEAMKKSGKGLESLIKPLLTIGLGGTAIGTCQNASKKYIGIVRKELAKITKLKLVTALNLVAATQDQTIFSRVSSSLKILAINLSKMANDLRLLSSGPKGGIGEIVLPALQPGSSIMPGKVNPVMPELVKQIYFLVMGNDLSISLACESAQLELNVMMPTMADRLIDSFGLINNVMEVFGEKCIKGIRVNKKTCKENLERSTAYATVLAKKIGYDEMSKVVKEAEKTNKTLRDIILKRKLMSIKEFNKIIKGEKYE